MVGPVLALLAVRAVLVLARSTQQDTDSNQRRSSLVGMPRDSRRSTSSAPTPSKNQLSLAGRSEQTTWM